MLKLEHSDVIRIREDFPILKTQIRNKPLIYFDNAASNQKPKCVIDAMSEMYLTSYSNVHRGVHSLCEVATKQFEQSRDKVAELIHAKQRESIVFVRGTTEAINLVAQSFLRPRLSKDDEILISAMEHHSNIVPWQLVCEQTGARLKVAPINESGEIDIDQFSEAITNKTKFVSLVHVSNTLGTINPAKQLIQIAHQKNIPVMLDGAQAVSHVPIDVVDLDCDFYAFSSHKLYGPSGIGVLYGKTCHLHDMPPYHGGGEMIREVTFEKSTYNDLPYKFEAGTPAIVEAVGLGQAIDYVQRIGIDAINQYEDQLLHHAMSGITRIPDVRLIGTAESKTSILSFVFGQIHAHDVGTILDNYGIAIRSGHHCTMPLMKRFNISATARVSFALYNTVEEIDTFLNHLEDVRRVFR